MTDAAQDIRIAEEDRLRVEVYDLLAALLADPPSKERLRALGRLVGDTTPFGTAVDTLAKLARATSAATVERAIAMSHDKYCSASIMLAKTAEITTSFELLEA